VTLIPIDDDGVLVKRETGGYGVDPTPVATDRVRIAERAWLNIPEEYEFPNERDTTAGGDILGAPPAVPAGRVVTATIPVELAGSGTVDTPPEWGPLLRSCGCGETINASTSVVYTRAISSHDSCTIYAYAGGLRFILLGCRGTFTVEAAGGQLGILRFVMQGIMSADPTEQSVPAITYGSVLPPVVTAVTFTVGGVALDAEGFEFAQNAEVVRIPSPVSGQGVDALKIAIPHMRPRFTVRAKPIALATYNPWADSEAATLRAIQLRYGTAGGNRFTLDVANGYVRAPGREDQSGMAGLVLEYLCRDFTATHD
jgi:hypothetical protein